MPLWKTAQSPRYIYQRRVNNRFTAQILTSLSERSCSVARIVFGRLHMVASPGVPMKVDTGPLTIQWSIRQQQRRIGTTYHVSPPRKMTHQTFTQQSAQWDFVAAKSGKVCQHYKGHPETVSKCLWGTMLCRFIRKSINCRLCLV